MEQLERYYTVAQVAEVLQLSDTTVIEHFAPLEGVIDLGSPTATHKRRKRILRIPPRVFEQYLASRAATTVRKRRR
jgi:hypothetical protein